MSNPSDVHSSPLRLIPHPGTSSSRTPAGRTLVIGRVTCNILRNIQINRSRIATYVDSVGEYLSNGDTVRIRPACNCYPVLGRIIGHSSDYVKVVKDAHHPYVRMRMSPNDESQFIHIQLYIERNNEIFLQFPDSELPVVDALLSDYASLSDLGILEVFETNVAVWVSQEQVSNCCYFIHVRDCLEQKYGPVNGRANAFFIRCRVTFPSCHSTRVEFEEMKLKEYKPFGPNSGCSSTVLSATERRLQGLANISRTIDGLVEKACFGRKSFCEQMPRDIWHFLLTSLDINSTFQVNLWAKQHLRLPNLSVGQTFVVRRTETIVIIAHDDFCRL